MKEFGKKRILTKIDEINDLIKKYKKKKKKKNTNKLKKKKKKKKKKKIIVHRFLYIYRILLIYF